MTKMKYLIITPEYDTYGTGNKVRNIIGVGGRVFTYNPVNVRYYALHYGYSRPSYAVKWCTPENGFKILEVGL